MYLSVSFSGEPAPDPFQKYHTLLTHWTCWTLAYDVSQRHS